MRAGRVSPSPCSSYSSETTCVSDPRCVWFDPTTFVFPIPDAKPTCVSPWSWDVHGRSVWAHWGAESAARNRAYWRDHTERMLHTNDTNHTDPSPPAPAPGPSPIPAPSPSPSPVPPSIPCQDDLDCAYTYDRPFCLHGVDASTCVSCIDDSTCDPGETCSETNACVPVPTVPPPFPPPVPPSPVPPSPVPVPPASDAVPVRTWIVGIVGLGLWIVGTAT